MRAGLEAWLHRQWARRGLLAWTLAPLSLLFLAAVRLRHRRWHEGKLAQTRLPVPVLVVGNIYLGGTGKTPVTIALVRSLVARGFRPGVISRGWGRRDAAAQLVTAAQSALEVGDEPLLIARATGVPVAVARARAAAGQLLLAAHPECDVLIADDGLQHLALARDIELAVIGTRGLGNGWVLPAGPLREPPARLNAVDAIVLNGCRDPIASTAPRFAATSQLGAARPLAHGAAVPLSELARRQGDTGLALLAAAGIGAPDRFFAMLRGHGLVVEELPLPDHFDFSTNPFADSRADLILITEKDAVKCATRPEIARDPRVYVVGLELTLDERLVDLVTQRIKESARGFPID
ncbi:MAG: tetraacyldisaccharide 4'-kinase [Burkholderiaceae bacterium]